MILPEWPHDPKDQWDVLLKCISIVGAIIAFWLGLYRWKMGQAWQRAAKGRELVDELLKSDDSDQEYYAWDAMKMLDYQSSGKAFMTKPILLDRAAKSEEKRRFQVDHSIIKRALASSEKDETDPKLLYVRECFDELYFKLGQLQDAIDNKLVELRHVSCPMDYYASKMAKDVEVHYEYMAEYEYQRALNFLENFPVWETARVGAGFANPAQKSGMEKSAREQQQR